MPTVLDELSITKLEVTEYLLTAYISDGRIISIPVAWFEALRNTGDLHTFHVKR